MKHSNIVYFSLILLFVISSCGNRSANNSSIYSFDTPTIDVEDSIAVKDTVMAVSSLMFKNTDIYDTTYQHRSDSLLAIRHKGIIVKGKSSTDSHKDKGMFYLPVNEQYQYIEGGKNSDIVFEFYLPDGFKSSDSIILSYKLKGAYDFTSLSKKINNSSVVGGMYFKRDTSWSLQREELPYFALKKGKNTFRYELPNGVSDIVAIKDIQLNIISKNKRGDCVIVNQPDNRCFYRTFGYLQGFIDSEAKLLIDGKPIATDKGFFETIVHRKTVVGDSWLSTLEVLYPNGKKIRKEVQFICSTDYDFSSTKGTYSQRIEQTITPDNAFDISLMGARLTGEKGGVATSRNLSITALRSIDMSVVSSDIINVTAEAAGYRFLPSGLKFDTVHIMALSYEPKLIPQGYTADDVFTFYYDEQTQRWQRIERSRVDTVNHIIYSYTDHFTDYINGILKAPELPDVQAYVPTTIKDLQAAHPHTGIGSFSVPEANNKGTANTSMPLWVPAGRNGLQPNLILAYNSAGGNGWLGQGWDIPISSIEVETRWGVPLYDTDYETETYLLDGETLLLSYSDGYCEKPTYRRDFDERIKEPLRFYREIEGTFQKIVRYGNYPSEYYFVVTDKNGTKMTYGNDGSSNNVCEQKDQIGNKAKWLLTKIEDANGNWMKFSYQTKSYQGGSNIYIYDIEYTGNGNEGGNYRIVFNLSDTIRPDVMSNGRKGLFEVSAHLLDRIDVIYKVSNEVLRQYYFGYQQGAYGKTLLSNMLDVDSTFRHDENINIFTKSDIFDRNANRESAKNYYPIKYYFSYHGGYMKYSEDKYVTSNYDTPPFTYIANNIVNNVFGNLSSIKPGSLGGSTTSAWGAGGAFSVGFDWLAALRTFSAGGKFDYNRESGEAFLTLVDLNGDGYPDKLFKKDGVLCYRLYELNNNKPHSFGDIHQVDNIQDFNQATNSSHIFGIEAQAGFSRRIGCSFGADLSYARSSTNVYLSDVDGDGLVDIVDNNRGKVFFNRIKYGQGFQDQTTEMYIKLPEASCGEYFYNDKPVNLDVFKSGIPDTIQYEICVPKIPHIKCDYCRHHYDTKNYLAITCCHIHDTVKCMTIKKTVYEADKELHVPDVESVKAWIAPYDGKIDVVSWGMLVDYLRDERIANNIMDGVTISIQKSSVSAQHTSNNQPEILVRKTIFPFKYFDIASMKKDSIDVNKGDILYFRVQSNDKHALDILKWEIRLSYIHIRDTSGFNVNDLHFRGDSFGFGHNEDFILNGKQEINYIFNGNACIEYQVRIDDDFSHRLGIYPLVLKYEEYQRNSNGDIINYTIDTLFSNHRDYLYGFKNISISGVVDSNINTHRFGRFYLDCEDKGIDWTKVDAKVRVYYRHISDAIPGSNPPIPITPIKEIIGYDTIYNVEYRPVVEKKCLQYAKQPSFYHYTIRSVYKIQLECQWERDSNNFVPNNLINDTLIVIIRRHSLSPQDDGIVWHIRKVPVVNGVIPLLNLGNYNPIGGHFYIDVYAPGIAGILAKNMTARFMEYNGTCFSSYNRVGLYANYSHKYIPNKRYSRFGSIYRGWTQFGYKPADKFSPYIDENLLNTDYLDSIQQGGQTSYIPNTSDTIVIPANFSDASILSSQNGRIKTFDPLRYNFFPMNADASNNRYVAYGGAYMAKDTMSNTITDQLVAVAEDESFPVSSESWDTSYYNSIKNDLTNWISEQDDVPDSEQDSIVNRVINRTTPPTLAKTVKKRTNTYNIVNLRGNASFAGLGHGLTYSHSNSKLVSDYMDMNGDRYPDILGDQAIQYSKQQGGLSDKIVRFNSSDMYDIDVSVSNAIGSGVSGSKNHVISEQAICSSAKKSVVKVKSRGGSVGEGIALAWNDNKATWQDINGDGLPDRIIDKDTVRVAYINLGYSFTNPIKLKNAVMRKSTSVSLNKSIGGGIGNSLNVYNQCVGNGSGTPNSFDVALSFSGGLSRSGSLNHMKRTFMDVNGDGLADIVEYVNPALPVEDLASNISPIQFDISNLTNDRVVVYYNNGSGFTSTELLKAENTGIDESVSSNFGGNIAGSMGFTIGFLPIKFVGTVSGYINFGANNEVVKLMDFNNDGYPDFVRVSPNDNTKIIVNYAEPSATNLLASIEMPTNMRVDINYTLTERSTVDNPFRYWNMTECKRSLFEKVNVYSYLNRFEYHNRRYNRSQREDGGYKTVVTKIMTNQIQNNNGGIVIGIQNSAPSVNKNNIVSCNTDKESHWFPFNAVYMTVTDTYINDGSLFRGLKTGSTVEYDAEKSISDEYNQFALYDIKTGCEVTDGCSGSVYPALKEVYLLTYEKESSEPLKTRKKYTYCEYGNVKSYRTDHSSGDFVEATFKYHNREKPYIVGTVSDITYRASNSNITYRRISDIDSRGNITEINNNGAINNYNFDRYGNTTRVFYPANGNGQRKSVTIYYDNVLKALPVSVYDMWGYKSTTAYDYRYQVPIQTTDIGGSVMLYSYDTKGRLKSVKTPKDPVYTVKYQYWDTYDMSKYIQNGAFADYRRSVYKWVETSHYNVDYPSMPMKTVVFADAFGRIDATVKFIDFGDGRPRRAAVYGGKCYDAVGNVLREYTEPLIVDSAHNNSGMLQGVYPTNDNEIPVWYTDIHSIYAADKYWYGKYRSYTRDEKGRAVAIQEPDGTVSRMAYAIDGGLSKTSLTDALGNTSHVWHDARGQTVKTQSPMGAVTQFRYDGLGELLQTIDPEGYTTLFYYDELGRIRETSHPSRGITEYLYDGATSNIAVEYNPLGKIEYEYDRLGRQIAKRYSENPQNNVFYQYGSPSGDNNSGRLVKVQDATGVTEYQYGSMGEVELEARTHVLFGERITYLTEWKYDSWGRARKILYPDGEEVHYRYNKTGLLSKVESSTNGEYITNIRYNCMEQREKVSYGNGTYTQYKYDPLMYRLLNYSLSNSNNAILDKDYKYNSVGNVEYQQDFYKFANIGYDIDNEYRYDADNRLEYSNGHSSNSRLRYDFEMKYSPSGKIQYKNLNSTIMKNGTTVNNSYNNEYIYNKYDNPYAVTDIEDFGNGHIYSYCWDNAGNMTYACHIGKPKTSEMYFWTEDNRMQAYAAKEEKNDLAYYRYDHMGKREMKLLGNLLDVYNMGKYEYLPYFSDMVLYAGDLMTFDKQGIKKHYFVEGERFLTNCGSEGHPSVYPLESIKGIEPEDPIYMSKNFENNIISYFTAHKYSDCRDTNIREAKIDELLMYRYKEFADILRDNQKPEFYYLHTDRLGSGSAVTDGSGKAVHVLGYMPYGETLLDLSHTHYETPYQFTGYEKDQETGLHYAEARYYDSWLSIFNSTDPMWYKYPHLSPYAYCADNPVMLVDLDGRDPIYAKKFWGGVRKIGDDGKCGSGSYLVRGSIARDVKAATRAGEFYSGDLSQGNNVMHIPTGKILDGVQHTVISTLNSGNTPETRVESGGHALISDITARIWDSGTSMKTETLPNGNILKKWGVLPFKIDNKKGQVGGQASTIRFIWHTHPNGDIPSGNKDEGDMYWVYHLKEHGFTGNSFLIDVENNRVTFYNEKGVIMNIHYNDFIKMGKQEDIK